MTLFLEYVDLLLALVGAAVVAILGLTGDFNEEHLAEATLLVLAAISATLVRDRFRRDRLVQTMDATFRSTTAGLPWQVLKSEHTWDISTFDGSMATVTLKRLLRFLVDEVVAIHEVVRQGDGTLVSCESCGGRPGGAMKKLVAGTEIDGDRPGSPKRRILQVGEMSRRGERFETITTQTLSGAFLKPREDAAVVVRQPTDEVFMKVVWPAGRAPRSVSLTVNRGFGNRGPTEDVIGSLRTDRGRKKFERSFPDPQVGDEYVIHWDWE